MYAPINCLLALLLVFLAGCGGSGGSDTPGGNNPPEAPINPTTLSFKTLYDSEAKFRILLPDAAQWLTITLDDDPEVLAEIVKYANDESIEAEILLIKTDGDVRHADPDLASAQLISSRSFSFANTEATEEMLNATIHDGNSTFSTQVMLISTEINGIGYAILYIADDDKFNRYLDVARHIASSLHIGHALFSNFYLTSDLDQPGQPGVAGDGSDILIVTCRPESRNPDIPVSIVAKLVSEDRTVGPEITIYTGQFADSNEDCESLSADVAFDGQNYLVTYNAAHYADAGVYGTRLSSNGVILDQTPIFISGSGAQTFRSKVAFDGTKFLVVWYRYGYDHRIEGTAVASNGTVGTNFTVALLGAAPSPQEPFIVASSNNTAIAWTRSRFANGLGYDSNFKSISVQLLSASQIPQLSTPVTITTKSGTSLYWPALASNGSQFLVSWIAYAPGQWSGDIADPGIYGVRLSNEGIAIDPVNGGKQILAPSMNTHLYFLNAKYHDGKYFFAWSDISTTPTAGVYAMSASEDLGTATAPIAIPATADDTANDFLPMNRQPAIFLAPNHVSFIWPTTGVELWDIDYAELE